MGVTFTFRVEADDVKKLDWLFDRMKKDIDGVSVRASAYGDLFAYDTAFNNLLNKIDRNDLSHVDNWYDYDVKSTGDGEYYDIRDMVDDFCIQVHGKDNHNTLDSGALKRNLAGTTTAKQRGEVHEAVGRI